MIIVDNFYIRPDIKIKLNFYSNYKSGFETYNAFETCGNLDDSSSYSPCIQIPTHEEMIFASLTSQSAAQS